MENMKQLIGSKIKEFRERRGFSQSWLAKKLGVVQGFISLVEAGKRSIDADLLFTAADVLGYNISDFYRPSGETPKESAVGEIKCPNSTMQYNLYSRRINVVMEPVVEQKLYGSLGEEDLRKELAKTRDKLDSAVNFLEFLDNVVCSNCGEMHLSSQGKDGLALAIHLILGEIGLRTQ